MTVAARLGGLSPRAQRRLLLAAVIAAAAAYLAHVVFFFPDAQGRLGDDYDYFLPLLLAGKYWVAQNGPLALPWFSPAFCGGLPFLANPQSIYFSLPQALSFVMGPVGAFMLTTVLFAGAGALGTYALMRRRFESSVPAAAVGAVVFLCNGFLLHRMGAGHVTYHVFGLVPLLSLVLLTPLDGERSLRGIALRASGPVALAGAMLAYFIFAGAPNIVVPAGIACVAIWLLHSFGRRPVYSFWLVGGAAGCVAAAAAAMKIVPAAVFVAQFPRVHEIVLFEDPLFLARVLLMGLFLPGMLPEHAWFVGRHELDYGVGLFPLLIAVAAWGRFRRACGWRSLAPGTVLRLAALLLLLTIPVFLNLGGPGYAAWLKTLPYVGDSTLLVRWFFIYVLPLTVGAGLALDYALRDSPQRSLVAAGGILVTALPLLLTGSWYRDLELYDPAGVVAADRALAAAGAPPAVRRIGNVAAAAGWNDGLVSGASSHPCYEPLFGYHLESFPRGLTPGPLGGERHLRNPACYVYGAENGCTPGASFSDAERAEESAFAAYRPFAYQVPRWQRWANWISVAGIAAIVLGLALGAAGSLRRVSRLTAMRRHPSLAG